MAPHTIWGFHTCLRANCGCSSTASSSRPRRARRSTTSTRPPRRCSARSPTPRSRRHAPGHRRRPAGVRRDRLVDEPRVPQALPPAAAGRRSRPSRRASARSSSSRSAARACSPTARSSTHPLARRPAAGRIEHIDAFAWERRPRELADAGTERDRQVWKEPVGVVGAIVPWNFPFEVTLNKLGQALATGNTVVLKPAPDTPWNATRLGRLVAEQTDIPAGVRQRRDVVRPPRRRGAHPLPARSTCISFTGSTAVGKRIMEKGARDHEAPVPRARRQVGHHRARRRRLRRRRAWSGIAVCVHAGQGCAIPTRMLLPRSRYDEGVELIAADAWPHVPYGDPAGPEATSWAR